MTRKPRNTSQKQQRKSIRLQDYDYSQAAMYFVTFCVQDRVCIFGDVVDQKMVLNRTGLAADYFWKCIPEHFPDAVLHDHIVMPNHIHGIIELTGSNTSDAVNRNRFQQMIPRSISAIIKGYKIGVTKWLRYGTGDVPDEILVGAENFLPLPKFNDRAPETEPSIWQRSFHDHIIRNQEEYYRISNYIRNNPKKWTGDKFHPLRMSTPFTGY